MRGIEIDHALAEIKLFWVWWSIDLVFVSLVVVWIDSFFLLTGRKSLGFVWASKLTWFFVWAVDVDLVLVWGIELRSISVQGSELFFLCLGVKIELVYSICMGSWLGYCVMFDRKLINGVLTGRCACYVLQDPSVTVDWVAQWFVLDKRTAEVRVSKSHRSRSSVSFSEL